MWRLTSALLVLSFAARSEEPPPPRKFYKIDFVVKEVEGARTVNARSFSITGAVGSFIKIRSQGKIHWSATEGPVRQLRQTDVGVNVDFSDLRELPQALSFRLNADVGSIPADSGVLSDSNPPAIRHNSWDSIVLVVLNKPTTVVSSDDLTSKRKMQIEVTATPLK